MVLVLCMLTDRWLWHLAGYVAGETTVSWREYIWREFVFQFSEGSLGCLLVRCEQLSLLVLRFPYHFKLAVAARLALNSDFMSDVPRQRIHRQLYQSQSDNRLESER